MSHKIVFNTPLEIDFDFIEGNSDGSTHDEIIINNLEDIESEIVSYIYKLKKYQTQEED